MWLKSYFVCGAGVYQEVMGSMHNMFGSLNTVVIKAGEPEAVPSPGMCSQTMPSVIGITVAWIAPKKSF